MTCGRLSFGRKERYLCHAAQMKSHHAIILTIALSLWADHLLAKPEGAVEGVNQMAKAMGVGGGEAQSPAAAFFTLLMLGELDGGETGARIRRITGVDEWRSDGTRPGGTVGWISLDNTWWVDRIDNPSDEGRRTVERFRGKVTPVDFWGSSDLKESGIGRWLEPREARALKGVLVTEAHFQPRWRYEMRPAVEGIFRCKNGREVEREFIQSHIIPVKVWDQGGVLEMALALDGGGEAFFSTGEGVWKGESDRVEAIVFIPKFTGESIVNAGAIDGLGKVASEGSEFGGLFSYGGATISKWLVSSKVDFREGGGRTPQDLSAGKKFSTPPVVLRIDSPFCYKITGAHGEIIMQGRVDCDIGQEEKP